MKFICDSCSNEFEDDRDFDGYPCNRCDDGTIMQVDEDLEIESEPASGGA